MAQHFVSFRFRPFSFFYLLYTLSQREHKILVFITVEPSYYVYHKDRYILGKRITITVNACFG